MHELSIAQEIRRIAEDIFMEHHRTPVLEVEVLLGKMSGVEKEALHFCFDAVIKDSLLEGAKLQIIDVPVAGRCIDCDTPFEADRYVHTCPSCGSVLLEYATGRELKVSSVVLDDKGELDES